MRKLTYALFTLLAATLCAGTSRAQITSVILAENKEPRFHIVCRTGDECEKAPTYELLFPINKLASAMPPDAKITGCELLMVALLPKKLSDKDIPSDQDVKVFREGQPSRWTQWSARSENREQKDAEVPLRYRAPLDPPDTCKPDPDPAKRDIPLKLSLQAINKPTDWTYSGGSDVSQQPRLIVTYTSASSGGPAKPDDTTAWKYHDPDSFFWSTLWKTPAGETILTNPVSLDGAIYLIVEKASKDVLYRVGGASAYPIPGLPDSAILKGSAAFVTRGGRLQVATKDHIYSCSLEQIKSGDKNACASTARVDTDKPIVQPDQPPAMGADGSLYLRKASGSLEGYNPLLRKMWDTAPLKANRWSQIALSKDGRYAFALGNIDAGVIRSHLVRIDTQTGEILPIKITETGCSRPPGGEQIPGFVFETLLRPTVATRGAGADKTDFVFVAGNDATKGILRLCAISRENSKVEEVWTTSTQLVGEPVPGPDGNSIFYIAKDGKLMRLKWYVNCAGAGQPEFYCAPKKPVEEELPGQFSSFPSIMSRGSEIELSNYRSQECTTTDAKATFDLALGKVVFSGEITATKECIGFLLYKLPEKFRPANVYKPGLGVKDPAGGDQFIVIQPSGEMAVYDHTGRAAVYEGKVYPLKGMSFESTTSPLSLLADQAGSIYLYQYKPYRAAAYNKEKPPWTEARTDTILEGVQFTGDGTVIGYTDKTIYDLSPRTDGVVPVKQFDPLTIYSADIVTAAAGAAADLAEKSEVVLKGNRVELPRGFKWPVGRTLRIQSVYEGPSKRIDLDHGISIDKNNNSCSAAGSWLEARSFPNTTKVVISGEIKLDENCFAPSWGNNNPPWDNVNFLYKMPPEFRPKTNGTPLASRGSPKQEIVIYDDGNILLKPLRPGGGSFTVHTVYDARPQ